ncbi:MAG: DoxX family membrane protein [Flavobacteriales bacterium]|nr:DoxX family membrane protein [Flavobacteriales bacterium]
MNLIQTIQSLKEKRAMQLFYWLVRAAMGLTFIISGIRKLPGIEFTQLPLDNPVGAFFHAMHETGLYWHFIGGVQIALGALIFFNRTVVVSSLIMMPITVNIFLVSIAFHMQGTPFITTAMLLANMFLLGWNYKNYLGIVKPPL